LSPFDPTETLIQINAAPIIAHAKLGLASQKKVAAIA
jgi:hypothetical protein